jgi:4-amino-4-deoxy-L-arabinose transferase-like glycosyltransferase
VTGTTEPGHHPERIRTTEVLDPATEVLDPPATDAPDTSEQAPAPDGGGRATVFRPVGGPMRTRRFGVALTAIVLAGLGVRVAYILVVTRHENSKLYDSLWYGFTGLGLSIGQFFRVAFGTAPSAAHPPLTSLLLAPSCWLFGFHAGTTPQRMTMAILGTAVVLCIGLLGRSLAGPWVGLTAAFLAAGYPNFWIPNGILMSETPAMLGMALILMAIVRLRRRPTVVSALLLGAACGAEALVRAELILFVPMLLVPAALAARPASLRRKVGLLGLGVLATAFVLAPWVGRNLATFKDPTYISTGDGLALLGANCKNTYYGPSLGSWALGCAISVSVHGDESVQSEADQTAAIRYIRHHESRLPVVVAARVGRLWDFFEPVQMADYDVNEGRPRDASIAGLVVYYALLPFALAGIVILRRRRMRQWILLVPAAALTLTAALFYGLVRFRAPFEDCLVLLAAPALVLTVGGVGRMVAWGARLITRRGHHTRQPVTAGS